MPATVRDYLPRLMCLLVFAAPLSANSEQDIVDLFTEMASALSAGNGPAFLDHVDRSMPGYYELEKNILALTAQNELLSSVEFLKNEGDDTARSVELDWLMQIRSRAETGPLEQRRGVVKCRLQRIKKKWKVVALEPVDFFAPPAVK